MDRIIQPVLDERIDPSVSRSTVPTSTSQARDHPQNGSALYNGFLLDISSRLGELNGSSSVLKDTAMLTSRLLSYKSNPDIGSNFGVFATVVSRLHRHLLDVDVEISYTEYLDLMKLEVDEQLKKLKEDIKGLKSYTLPDNGHATTSCLGMSRDVKLIEVDERFNGLKLLLAVVFRQIREMLGLVNGSMSDLRWEHELQLEVTGILIGDCIRVLQDELERKLYEQSTIINTMSKNWQENVTQFAAMREDLDAISKLLLPSEPESHISHSKHESSGNRSNRWKYNFFGKKSGEDRSPPSSEENGSPRTQKSISSKEVISEKSDFRHLKGMTREEMINYFKSEISKLKRLHELALQEKTEELFKFKREKGSLALQKDVEFEPLRNKIPKIISRMDQIIAKNIKVPVVCSTRDEHDEIGRLNSRIDSLYYENQHLRGLLADKTKEVKELSCQLSDASRKISLQSSLESELLRQTDKIKGEYEDLQIEGNIRDGLQQTVARKLIDDYRISMENTVLNFHAKMSSLEVMLSEKENASCLANEENQKLKEKLAVLQQVQFNQDHHENPELVKQENNEMILRDIEMEPHALQRRSHETSEQGLQCEELIKLNQNLEIASSALEEVEKKNSNYHGILIKKEQEKQLECIMVSMMDLSKEFVEIEYKLSRDSKGTENRSENVSDRCNHMVQQAIVLTKKGLWYKQMLETRRSELQKAEAEVDILGDKVNALLSLLQKIYVTLDHYSPVFQHYPGLLDAFLKTCKLVAGLRGKQNEDRRDTTSS